MKMKACCFTGHRKLSSDTREIRRRIRICAENYINNGGRYFACGGAIGFDMVAAEEIIDLKEKYPHIHLILLLPFPGYEKKWSDFDKENILKLMKKSIYKYVKDKYTKDAYFLRDRKLVEGSDTCICYLSKSGHSGTRYTAEYAAKKGLWITNVADNALWTEDQEVPFQTMCDNLKM